MLDKSTLSGRFVAILVCKSFVVLVCRALLCVLRTAEDEQLYQARRPTLKLQLGL